MNARRFPTVGAALCGTVVLAIWLLASFAILASVGIERPGAVPIEARPAPSLAADAELADAPQATAISDAVVANADAATAADPVTQTATDTPAASDEPESIVEAALPASPQMLPPETPPVQVATASTPEPVSNDAKEAVRPTDTATAASGEPESIVEAALPASSQTLPTETPPVQVATASTPDPVPSDAKEAVRSIEVLDECPVADNCIDRYLWALYQRTPKEDTNKVLERRKVTVRKRGKMVTVTKSFTKLVDQDFTWKDPKAAEKAGMPMMDYVIGGMG